MYGVFDDGRDGSQLFRELLRLLPSVHMEDYCHNGVWDRENLLLDFELIERHREQAGAPTPPSLEDIPEVELPGEDTPLPWRTSGSSKPSARPSLPPPPPPPTPPFIDKTTDEEQAVMADFADMRRAFVMGDLELEEVTAKLSQINPSQCRLVAKNYVHNTSSLADTSLQLGGCVQSQSSGMSGNKFRVVSEATVKTLPRPSCISRMTPRPSSRSGKDRLSKSRSPLRRGASWKVSGRSRSRSPLHRGSSYSRNPYLPSSNKYSFDDRITGEADDSCTERKQSSKERAAKNEWPSAKGSRKEPPSPGKLISALLGC